MVTPAVTLAAPGLELASMVSTADDEREVIQYQPGQHDITDITVPLLVLTPSNAASIHC